MLHDLTVGQGWLSSYEFWRSTPGQIWWLVEAKTPEEAKRRGRDMDQIVQMVKAAKRKEAA